MSGALLHAIRCYCAEHHVAPSTFGRLAVKDPRLVSDLRAGRSITDRRAERVRSFMRAGLPSAAQPVTHDPPRQASAYVPAKRSTKQRQAQRRYVTRSDDPHPILADIALFLARTGMADSMFGYHALGDYNFVEDVRCGRDIRRATERRVRAFMSEA